MERTPLWLGSQENYQSALDSSAAADKAMMSGMSASSDPMDSFDLHGSVAVIGVSGPLTNNDSFFGRLMGLTSYGQIRNSLIDAANSPDVKAIVLNIDSGGGSPNGLPDASTLVQRISASGIPVYAYTGGMMASAAYWLGSSATKVFASPTATVGSIGVLATHMDMTKAMEMEGVTPTVIRAGSEKALVNPYEKLSPEALANAQQSVDKLYTVFIDAVAQHRGVSADVVASKMADGKEFGAKDAVKAGLIDGLSTLDTLVGAIQSNIDLKKPQNGKEAAMKKKLMTPQAAALIAEGISPELALQTVPPTDVPDETPDPVTPAPEDISAAPAVAAAPSEGTPAAPVDSELVSFLRTSLAAKDNDYMEAKLQVADLQRQLESFKVTQGPLMSIVATRIQNMQIALNSSPADTAGLNAETLVNLHAGVHAQFTKTFPVGGVTAQPSTDVPKAVVTPLAEARARAVKL